MEYYDIVNYETFRNGKTYDKNYKFREKSPYLNINDKNLNLNFIYKWKVPKNAIIIFDEAHRCKDPSTDNGKLLISTKQLILKGIPIVMLSATICEKFSDMKIPFYLFGFIPNVRNFCKYMHSIKHKYPEYNTNKANFDSIQKFKTAYENAQAMIIYEEIKELTSRIRVKDLGNKFPINQWCAQQFIAKESNKISNAYNKIEKLLKEFKEYPCQNILAKIQKLKQGIELRKIPIFIEQAQLYLEEGKSVIIFVNYLNTLKIIEDELSIRCKICGNQNISERQYAIELFQNNTEKIIICQIRAGSVGISLHDIHGNHPRVTLINFPDSASDLLQALGRAPRAGAKTPVLQRIILVANVEYEKKIMQNINKKLSNISAINDGDLNGYKYKINNNAHSIYSVNNL